MKSVCVLGLGYIGLPTASILATQGYEVLGVDVAPYVVNTINQGGIHIEEPGLKTVVQAAILSGKLRAALAPEAADVFIIAVPTPFTSTKTADLSYVESAARSLIKVLKKGDLVILESTSPPGTTERVLAPILAESGLKIGEDLYVAHCPERVLPGKILKELIENTRVVGGVNEASTQKAAELYQSFVEGDVLLTDSTTAEMAKIMENTYRDVNIALANELAMICEKEGINAWDVVRFANRHPRVNIHSPGPGVGGHCISVDPWFIVADHPEEAQIIRMARTVNDGMPQRVVDKVKQAVQHIADPKITLLGLAYKANVDDTRESPAGIIYALLKEAGCRVCAYDPHVKQSKIELSEFKEAFRDSDCVLLVTNHDEFTCLDPSELAKLVRTRIVIDTRNCLNQAKWAAAGFTTRLLGNGKSC